MKNRFDRKAKEMDSHPVIQEAARTFSRTLKKHIPLSGTMRVLDYGCGSGLAGMHLYKNVGSLVMLDTSEGMLDLVREKIARHDISNIKVTNCDTSPVCGKEESFDLIYMSNVLHHIDDIPAFVRRLGSMLKSGGYLCIGDLTKEPGTFHEDNTDVKHFGFDESALGDILKRNGFKNIQWEEYYVVNKPDKEGCIRSYPLFFMHAMKA